MTVRKNIKKMYTLGCAFIGGGVVQEGCAIVRVARRVSTYFGPSPVSASLIPVAVVVLSRSSAVT